MSDEETHVHQIREFELSLSYEKAFKLCMKSLDLLEKHKVKESDSSQGRIIAEYKIPSTLIGVIVTSFFISRISDNKTHIKISSKPKIPTAIIDFGAIFNITNKIKQFLEEN